MKHTQLVLALMLSAVPSPACLRAAIYHDEGHFSQDKYVTSSKPRATGPESSRAGKNQRRAAGLDIARNSKPGTLKDDGKRSGTDRGFRK